MTILTPRQDGEKMPSIEGGDGGGSRSTLEEAAVPLLPPPPPRRGASQDRQTVEAKGRQLGNKGCSPDIRVRLMD